MRESLQEATALREGGEPTKSSYPLGENPPDPPTLDRIRSEAANVSRTASWQRVKMIAAVLDLTDSTIYNWTSGQQRSPVEAVAVWTDRALREGLPRESALAMVTWLARLCLTPDELEDLAAQKRAGDDGPHESIRIAARLVESSVDELLANGLTGEQALALRRNLKRLQVAVNDLEIARERSLSA